MGNESVIKNSAHGAYSVPPANKPPRYVKVGHAQVREARITQAVAALALQFGATLFKPESRKP